MNIIKRTFTDVAYYWAPGEAAVDGTSTYATPPKQIFGRKYEKSIVAKSPTEITITQQHRFATDANVKSDGWIFIPIKGTPLPDDLREAQPMALTGARRIVNVTLGETFDRKFQYWEIAL